LFQAVQFALVIAAESGGAFDPTVGHAMEMHGFNRNYRTRHTIHTPANPPPGVSYRDIQIDPVDRTITLLRPLVLDLGAVAKGLAVDLAARELQPFTNFAVNAGGDLFAGGHNANDEPWSIGIRHPRIDGELIGFVRVSNRAVCTSGDYERHASAESSGHHILDPPRGVSAESLASVTVIAPAAILADALATAAFVLGPDAGLAFIEQHGVDGLLISPALERFATRGMSSDYHLGNPPLLSHTQGPSHDRPGDSFDMRGAG
jgi:thiamine biosynthesis lipoprotein